MTFYDMSNHSYDWKRSCDSVALAGAESMYPLFWYRQVIQGSCVHRKHVEQNALKRHLNRWFNQNKWDSHKRRISRHVNHALYSLIWFNHLFIILQSHELCKCMECFLYHWFIVHGWWSPWHGANGEIECVEAIPPRSAAPQGRPRGIASRGDAHRLRGARMGKNLKGWWQWWPGERLQAAQKICHMLCLKN